MPRTSHACVTNVSLVPIGKYIRAVYEESYVLFRLCVGFIEKDFPRASYVALPAHAQQMKHCTLHWPRMR
jgi:hypothetical protein